MNDENQQSPAVRKANLHFRKETQAREGVAARAEYDAEERATRQKTLRLREERLARDAAAVEAAKPKAKAPRQRVSKSV